MSIKRRKFITTSATYGIGAGLVTGISPLFTGCQSNNRAEESSERDSTDIAESNLVTPLFFKISLAQWSLHRSLFNQEITNLDFAAKAKNDFGIEAVEYVNQFFKDKAKDKNYLNEMKKRTDDLGVTNVLIMIDGEGSLGAADENERTTAIENHYKWIEAAKFLGCHSIRVNARGEGEWEEIATHAADGLSRLSTFAKDFDINVIVENHGGPSSNGEWLSGVIQNVNMENCGTLPDFGNFCITRGEDGCEEMYDRYKGTEELMTFAKGVSAKTYNFDEEGNDVDTDFVKMLSIVKEAGYTGHIGIEYEGSDLPEDEGIRKTLALLKTAGAKV